MLIKGNKSEIKELIDSGKNIVLTSHTNPDGDAIGSLIAMYNYLKKLNNTVTMMVPNKFPEFYKWLPKSEDIIIYENRPKHAQKILHNADLIFALDFNALSRLGVLTDIVEATSCTRILIDHHIDPEVDKFNYCYSTTNVSSTAELVYSFIEMLGDEKLIDKNISEGIYTGIVTDTGSFSFSCNRPETYNITSKLISHGVDAQKIHKLIYDTFSENRLRLLGYAISERMMVWDEYHTALIYLSKEDLLKFNYQVGDTEGMVNYPLSMEKINMSVLISEKDNLLRLSFRSKGDFSVNDLCRKHFNGGGHKNAAGGREANNIDAFIKKLKSILEDYKNDLDYKISL
ncbi:MAG: bifunctional oligoribonuclease/PAP phosphatase NrnA [Lentimicrobiaceae bacterium]|jgi:phosphoesterase RecJ-like protein|nr:bifunctional oligoribonuclease/PAP phosphatase NrnA [Lentimicrobiaceae bacterium]MCP4911132.1 bifunctional oligoribonuclease/PAP phosphatase NrnA [Bacteroidota bacterium]MBT3454642.1 bifunctional oligoribonuclease/PAP phosphatase NrnA [Lentimicrobiaceae bacterium]MBT3818340.1 bifunctional oligoribonuclease/PAP phosphatase NrnA [Lentimicrobiaceae bacterium]MBT4062179.1 bifunctional oligoribonuclease/PAP phosphatase NrnA [Lentimicrobiaceae bacterium]